MTNKTRETIYRSVEIRLEELYRETKGIRNSRLVRDKRMIFMTSGLHLVTAVMQVDNESSLKTASDNVYNNEIANKQAKYKNKIPKARVDEIKENIIFLISLVKEELKAGSPGTAMLVSKKCYVMPQLKLTCRKTKSPFT